jgi:hypothetical protein
LRLLCTSFSNGFTITPPNSIIIDGPHKAINNCPTKHKIALFVFKILQIYEKLLRRFLV